MTIADLINQSQHTSKSAGLKLLDNTVLEKAAVLLFSEKKYKLEEACFYP